MMITKHKHNNFFGRGEWVGAGGLLKNKTKLSPARASLLGLSLAKMVY